MRRHTEFLRAAFCLILLLAAQLGAPASAATAERMQIAVADLERRSSQVSDEQVMSIGMVLRDALVRTGDVDVIERQRLDRVLLEQELQLSDLGSEQTILAIGRILPVSGLLIGTVAVLFDHLVISVRLVDVATAQTLVAENVYTDQQRVVQDLAALAAEVGLRARTLTQEITLEDVRATVKRRDLRTARLLLDTYLQRAPQVSPEAVELDALISERLADKNYTQARRALQQGHLEQARQLVDAAAALQSDSRYVELRARISEQEQLEGVRKQEEEKLRAARQEARRRRAEGTRGLKAWLGETSVNGFHLGGAVGAELDDDLRLSQIPAWYGVELLGTHQILRPPNEGRGGYNHLSYAGISLSYREPEGSGSFRIAPYASPALAWGLKVANLVVNLGFDGGAVAWFGGFVPEGYLFGLSGGGLVSMEVKMNRRGGIFAAARLEYDYFPSDPGRSAWEPRLITGLVF